MVDPDADILENTLSSVEEGAFVSWESLGKAIGRKCDPQHPVGYASLGRARRRLRKKGIDFAAGADGKLRGLYRLTFDGLSRKTNSVMGRVRRAATRHAKTLMAVDPEQLTPDQAMQRVGHMSLLSLVSKVATKRNQEKILDAVRNNDGKTLSEMNTTLALFGDK
jgi:hypothetical protein